MAVWNWFSQVFKYIYSRFANFEVDDACSVCTSNSHTNNLSSHSTTRENLLIQDAPEISSESPQHRVVSSSKLHPCHTCGQYTTLQSAKQLSIGVEESCDLQVGEGCFMGQPMQPATSNKSVTCRRSQGEGQLISKNEKHDLVEHTTPVTSSHKSESTPGNSSDSCAPSIRLSRREKQVTCKDKKFSSKRQSAEFHSAAKVSAHRESALECYQTVTPLSADVVPDFPDSLLPPAQEIATQPVTATEYKEMSSNGQHELVNTVQGTAGSSCTGSHGNVALSLTAEGTTPYNDTKLSAVSHEQGRQQPHTGKALESQTNEGRKIDNQANKRSRSRSLTPARRKQDMLGKGGPKRRSRSASRRLSDGSGSSATYVSANDDYSLSDDSSDVAIRCSLNSNSIPKKLEQFASARLDADDVFTKLKRRSAVHRQLSSPTKPGPLKALPLNIGLSETSPGTVGLLKTAPVKSEQNLESSTTRPSSRSKATSHQLKEISRRSTRRLFNYRSSDPNVNGDI